VRKGEDMRFKLFSYCCLFGMMALLTAGTALASSHSEAPAIQRLPKSDCTDLYAFRSPDDPNTVTIIANYIPLEEPNSGPNFHRFDELGRYEINVDNDQDAKEDITFEFDFQTNIKNPNTFLSFLPGIDSLASASYNLEQTFTVVMARGRNRTTLTTGAIAPPPRVGPVTTPSYTTLATNAVYTVGTNIKVFAGQRDDSFYADLAAIFDGLTIRVPPGNAGGGVDGLGGFNVHTIAIQVPIDQLTRNNTIPSDPADPAAIMGFWSDSYLPKKVIDAKDNGGRGKVRQVSRLGSPLVNEVVIALKDKDKWNKSEPKNDGQFLTYVTNPELATLLNIIHGINVPPTPRNDLVEVFLTGVTGLTKDPEVVPSEQLRLNVAIPVTASPNRLGVLGGDLQGFPNGRRPIDDVVDISLRAVAGVLVPGFDIPPNNQLGDGVDANDVAFLTTFPYLAEPHDPLTHTHPSLP
jgi:hypothetical protein